MDGCREGGREGGKEREVRRAEIIGKGVRRQAGKQEDRQDMP
jgi:hypothetical protein